MLHAAPEHGFSRIPLPHLPRLLECLEPWVNIEETTKSPSRVQHLLIREPFPHDTAFHNDPSHGMSLPRGWHPS